VNGASGMEEDGVPRAKEDGASGAPRPTCPRCIAFIGSGGKTTAIEQLAKKLIAGGKRVKITTTVRMYWPTDPALREIYVGEPSDDPKKMRGLPEEERRALLGICDCVLVEADGSKGRPLKFPRAFEPAIPPEAELVVLVAGLRGIGQKVSDAVHCPELCCAYLGVPPEHPVTAADVAALLALYKEKAAAQAPGARLVMLLNP